MDTGSFLTIREPCAPCFGSGLALGVDRRLLSAMSLCESSSACTLTGVVDGWSCSMTNGVGDVDGCFFRKFIDNMSFIWKCSYKFTNLSQIGAQSIFTLFKLLVFLSGDASLFCILLGCRGSGYLSRRGSKCEPSSMLRSRNIKSKRFLLGCNDSECWHSRFRNSSVIFLIFSPANCLK